MWHNFDPSFEWEIAKAMCCEVPSFQNHCTGSCKLSTIITQRASKDIFRGKLWLHPPVWSKNHIYHSEFKAFWRRGRYCGGRCFHLLCSYPRFVLRIYVCESLLVLSADIPGNDFGLRSVNATWRLVVKHASCVYSRSLPPLLSLVAGGCLENALGPIARKLVQKGSGGPRKRLPSLPSLSGPMSFREWCDWDCFGT